MASSGSTPRRARSSPVACCDGVPAQKNDRRMGSVPVPVPVRRLGVV